MWVKDFTWNTDCTNIHAHRLAKCIVINHWNFSSLRITCLLTINNSSKFSISVRTKAALQFIPGYKKHGRSCELDTQRKCYTAKTFTQRTIIILMHSAGKLQNRPIALQNCYKNKISKILWNTFSNTKLHQPRPALPPAGVTAGNGNNSTEGSWVKEWEPQKCNLWIHHQKYKKNRA